MLKIYYADVSPFGGKEHLSVAGKAILSEVAPNGEIARNKNGKPYFVNLPVHFNISHSYPYVVCAFADCEVGVDVEVRREVSERVAKRAFTDAERRLLDGGTDFLSIWTAKESVIKAYGGSVVSDCKKVDVSGLLECEAHGRRYYMQRVDIPHCVCHIATEQMQEQAEVIKIELKNIEGFA